MFIPDKQSTLPVYFLPHHAQIMFFPLLTPFDIDNTEAGGGKLSHTFYKHCCVCVCVSVFPTFFL